MVGGNGSGMLWEVVWASGVVKVRSVSAGS